MTYIVEDGTGVVGANQYISGADMAAYHTLYGNTAWTDAYPDEASQDLAALIASRDFDLLFNLKGRPLTSTQGLKAPRVEVWHTMDFDTELVMSSGNTAQIAKNMQLIRNAVCELSLAGLSFDPTGPLSKDGNVSMEETKVGDVMVRTNFFNPGSPKEQASLRRVVMIIKPLLESDPGSVFVKVRRG